MKPYYSDESVTIYHHDAEIEERYCEIAAKRMAQRTLFEAEGFRERVVT